MDRILVVGLGNPGDEYAETRHNIGFQVLDMLADAVAGRWDRRGGTYARVTIRAGGQTLILCKPLTYMNNSGDAVADALHDTGVRAEDLLVVTDDFALPLGTLRLRRRGSDGGHNGLHSIIRSLGTQWFPRLRCGIRREPMPAKEQIADFVLSPFDREELLAAKDMRVRAAEAVTEIAVAGYDKAMNRFNK